MKRATLAALLATLALAPFGAGAWAQDEALEGRIGELLEEGQTLAEDDDVAGALLEFEQMFFFEEITPFLGDLAGVAEGVVEDLLEGRRVSFFGYAEAGGGLYREHNSRTTDTLGIDPVRSQTLRGRAGGGMAYILSDTLTMDATLDYRYVEYREPGIRDDRDWRWRSSITRALDSGGSRSFGVRGRASYRGADGHRQDYGIFANRNFALNDRSRIILEAEYRSRDYPRGRERIRSRDTAEVWLRWTRSYLEGRGALQLTASGGREFETEGRPFGDQTFYGAQFLWTHSPVPGLGYYLFGFWEHGSYHEDIPEDEDDPPRFLTPELDIYELGAGFNYEFVDSWTIRPEILWLRDEGNTAFSDYESTEFWVNVRLAF